MYSIYLFNLSVNTLLISNYDKTLHVQCVEKSNDKSGKYQYREKNEEFGTDLCYDTIKTINRGSL